MPAQVNSVNVFTYETLVHALSGAAGSVVAMTTFFPLDTVRSRLQLEENREAKNTLATIQELTQREGFSTLYRGIVPVLQSLCASNFVYFYTFHGLKILRSSKEQSAGNDLLVASVAGIINVLTTTPLWVVNTRLKMKGIETRGEQRRNNFDTLYDGLIYIWKTEGIQKLWAGTLPSLLLVSNPAIQFMTYEAIKRRIVKSFGPTPPPAVVFFILGAIAKTVATTVTYPLQLAQTKLRHGHTYPGLSPKAGTLQILLYILKKHGLSGLYKGMEAKLLQTVLTAALMFSAYEKIAAFVFRRLNESEAMIKGGGGISVSLGVRGRQRSTIVLESSPSAEIASYDYEAALSEPKLEEIDAGDSRIAPVNSPRRNTTFEKNEPIPADLGKNGTSKAVYFSTINNQRPAKITSTSEFAGVILSPRNNTAEEYAACESIDNESGGERGKELPRNSLTPVIKVKKHEKASGALKDESIRSTPKMKTSWKNLVKKNVVNSVLENDKASKIPRATTATTITCATARVHPIARIPYKNSTNSLCTHSLSTTRSKPTTNSVEKEHRAEAKQDSAACIESSKNQVGSAGDHSPPPSTTCIFRNSQLNHADRISKQQRKALNLKLYFHDVQEPWSDSKSSPEIRSVGRGPKSPKTTRYHDSTSEEVDRSSEYSNDSMKLKKSKMSAQKASSRSRTFKSGYTRNSPPLKNRRRSHLSFLTTLFDIVFWPFLFLRTNR